jgi:hypothetical protein
MILQYSSGVGLILQYLLKNLAPFVKLELK